MSVWVHIKSDRAELPTVPLIWTVESIICPLHEYVVVGCVGQTSDIVWIRSFTLETSFCICKTSLFNVLINMNASLTRAIQISSLPPPPPATLCTLTRVVTGEKKVTGSRGRMSHLSIIHESRRINRRWCFKWEGWARQSARGVRKAADYTGRQ